MTDFIALNAAMHKCKKTKEKVAEELGIEKQRLEKCLNGFHEFTPKEILNISRILNLTTEEKNKIFYKAD